MNGTTILMSTADPSFLDKVLQWSKVSEPWELWLVAFGFIAQGVFFCRWLVQWIASERRRESHIPISFWWLSIVGASMLLIYFILRGEPVGVFGQLVGWIVYSRNLHLIKKDRRGAASADSYER